MLAQHLVEKHRRGLLHVVAAGVQQRVHREVGAAGQVVAVAAPGNGLAANYRPFVAVNLQRIESDADGDIFVERFQIALKPLFTHRFAGVPYKIFRQLHHFFRFSAAKLKKNCELCNNFQLCYV